MPLTTKSQGSAAEALAAHYLTTQGVCILERNVRCRHGEIDLIGLQHATVLFIEVRLRRSKRFGSAAESITPQKCQRLSLTATYWLTTKGRRYARYPCRFDALLLETLDFDKIQWIQAAFNTC